jgi:hypothetical protein
VVLESWVMAGPSDAIDVRRVNEGWEATVTDPSTPLGVPMVWRSSGEHTILADQGMAVGINGVGQIVGRTKAKGVEHAMLWTPPAGAWPEPARLHTLLFSHRGSPPAWFSLSLEGTYHGHSRPTRS